MYYSQALSVVVGAAITLSYAAPQIEWTDHDTSTHLFERKDGTVDIMPQSFTANISDWASFEIGGDVLCNNYLLKNVTGPDLKPGDHTIEEWKGLIEPLGEEKMAEIVREEFRRMNESIWPFFDTSSCVMTGPLRKRQAAEPPEADPARLSPERQRQLLREKTERIIYRCIYLVGLWFIGLVAFPTPYLNALTTNRAIQGVIAWQVAGWINIISGWWLDLFNYLRDTGTLSFAAVFSHVATMRTVTETTQRLRNVRLEALGTDGNRRPIPMPDLVYEPPPVVVEMNIAEAVARTESTDLPGSPAPLDGVDDGTIDDSDDGEIQPLVCVTEENAEEMARLLPELALPEANIESDAWVARMFGDVTGNCYLP